MIGFLVDLWRSRYWGDWMEWARRFRDLRYWRGEAKDRFQRNIRAATQELPPPDGPHFKDAYTDPAGKVVHVRPKRRKARHRKARFRALSLKQWRKRKARHHMARASRKGNR